MEGIYDVYQADAKIGKMYVDRQGLYYRFRCRCSLTGKVIYRIVAKCGNISENLGILVPGEGDFILDTRLPAKRFPAGTFSFHALPRHSALQDRFIPIHPQEPFSYLSRLKNARLEKRSGQTGIVIPEEE